MNGPASMAIRSALLYVALACSSWAMATNPAEIDAGVQATLQAFYAQSGGHRELANKAAAILVFPHVTKAGVGVGGLHGEGAFLVHDKTVKYYQVTGASLGATLGAAEHAEVILFMTNDARDKFERSEGWTIGADAGVAVASKGTGVTYDVSTLRRPILTFVLDERGLMGDLSLEGLRITPLAG